MNLFLLLVLLSPAAAEPALFVLDTAPGTVVRGSFEELRSDWSIRLGGTTGGIVAGSDVVALRRSDRTLPALPSTEHVILANGDRMPGQVLDLAGQYLRFRFQDGNILSLPLSALLVVWFAAPSGPETDESADLSRLLRRLAAETRTRDVVLLRNGDIEKGILTGLDAQLVRLDSDEKKLQIDRNKVAAIALNTELATMLRPPGRYGRVILRDGCRLSLASAQWSAGKTLSGVTLFRKPVILTAEDVVAIYVFQGAAVYLSDLKPRETAYNFYGSETWPFVADGTVDRRDLCLGGSTYDKGLGMHSETRLTYDLGGRYQRFEALVGLDPRTGQRGSVRLRVLVDGQDRIPGSLELTGQTLPTPLRIDVSKARVLTLMVEFGNGGPVQDHVNWADARLIR
jgi:hypothetical protein